MKFRSYLNEFLEYISSKYELVVFCKGSELYCKPVLDSLEAKTNYFTHRLYGNHVLFDNQTFSVKYYDFLFTHGRTNDNTIIVESEVESYCLNLFNGIPISSFNEKSDTELISLAKYLEDINKSPSIEKTIIASIKKCGICIL